MAKEKVTTTKDEPIDRHETLERTAMVPDKEAWAKLAAEDGVVVRATRDYRHAVIGKMTRNNFYSIPKSIADYLIAKDFGARFVTDDDGEQTLVAVGCPFEAVKDVTSPSNRMAAIRERK